MNPLIDGLHRRLGRNLLRFQEIELSLKLMLPYMHPDGGAKGTRAMQEYQARNVTGKSLGLLVEQFKSAISGTPELWEGGLAALLEPRNELVHHFYHQFDFVQPGSAQKAIEYLDTQYREAEEWWQILRVQSLVADTVRNSLRSCRHTWSSLFHPSLVVLRGRQRES